MSDKVVYQGLCSICGKKGEFAPREGYGTRDSYLCPHCRASLRWRDQAAIILDEFGKGLSISLANLAASGRLDAVDIFEPALKGPFVNAFKNLPRYVRSYYWSEMTLGQKDPNGVRNEDLTNLTFADDSFDLVITSDVMEHIYDYKAAFAQILRVLKPGGIHVFSIPTDWPLPELSEARVRVVDGVEEHIKPARYHTSGDGTPCIVYTDFGADLIDILDANGRSRSQAVRRHSALDPCYRTATFVTRKLC